jgi:hypothetical protein
MEVFKAGSPGKKSRQLKNGQLDATLDKVPWRMELEAAAVQAKTGLHFK